MRADSNGPVEFRLIDQISRHFPSDNAVIGIGDDAAIIPPLQRPTLTTDTLVAGRHFLTDADAADIGYKSLAVNLSDLAAMGAEPRYALLNLTLPEGDQDWVDGFVEGFSELAQEFEMALVGGDITAGPLSVTVTVIGEGALQPLLRRGALPGDKLFVSDIPGRAAHALDQLRNDLDPPERHLQALLRPRPRIALGQFLAGRATAGLDISDGLVGDLQHLLAAADSEPGAVIHAEALPVDADLIRLPVAKRLQYQLRGGDDYELLFTVPADQASRLMADWDADELALHPIGEITEQPGIQLLDQAGRQLQVPDGGFEHFA